MYAQCSIIDNTLKALRIAHSLVSIAESVAEVRGRYRFAKRPAGNRRAAGGKLRRAGWGILVRADDNTVVPDPVLCIPLVSVVTAECETTFKA